MWTGFIWLRTGTSGGSVLTRQWNFRFHKRRGIAWITEILSASLEGVCLLYLFSSSIALHSIRLQMPKNDKSYTICSRYWSSVDEFPGLWAQVSRRTPLDWVSRWKLPVGWEVPHLKPVYIPTTPPVLMLSVQSTHSFCVYLYKAKCLRSMFLPNHRNAN
jgi:hypothetical protein